ncbi:hypothetical protein TTHERM_001170538 (macronuclear) [Tetrahymena thermophila SB210]|uniref:Uncharacterized protein n=1 Tax=Tetrahymena thermophila (strain SB210) TaxID=312017 RepID=W7XLM0_TETTS|nr:hypothetical protein TTHERM_001170538 [Tetrahymena thermophila SB210]EWS76524.1 hypothetical protein TTHERM_001170538 [Tetrahymena thermophila SB210]|eukprot:XP_012650934.1 hypothetical protein TTHERM_001170538 [Tetrahymena thermophila SB210]
MSENQFSTFQILQVVSSVVARYLLSAEKFLQVVSDEQVTRYLQSQEKVNDLIYKLCAQIVCFSSNSPFSLNILQILLYDTARYQLSDEKYNYEVKLTNASIVASILFISSNPLSVLHILKKLLSAVARSLPSGGKSN